jgi:hypothetical protein
MRRAFDWKRSRISILEVDAVPQSCMPYVQMESRSELYGLSDCRLSAKLVPTFGNRGVSRSQRGFSYGRNFGFLDRSSTFCFK